MSQTEVAVPCKECGAELYDGVRKYHLDVPCVTMDAGERCYDMTSRPRHWSLGSYCWNCDALVAQSDDATPDALAAEHLALFPR